MAKPLEGDGLIENIYYYAWQREGDDTSFRGFYLPHTVIYKHQQPRSWFYSSGDGTIVKKPKDQLTTLNIEQAFLQSVSKSGIVAYFTYIGKGGIREIEFFEAEELKHFLHYRNKSQDGILQKFIDPKGIKNSQIQMVWSPSICLFEMRENTKDLYDLRYDLYERAVTFEGEEYHSRVMPLRGFEIRNYMRNVGEVLVEHVKLVTDNQMSISRMVIHFKIDAKDRLWLLMATSVRCQSSKPLDLVSLTKLPDTVNPKKVSSNPQNPVSLQKSVLCNNCENPCEVERMCDIAYKFVIDSNSQEIPKLIARNHPKMTLFDYLKHKKNVVFLNKKTLVCDDCYLKFTEPIHYAGAWTERLDYSPSRHLNPTKLSIRREITNLTKSLTPIKSRHLSTVKEKPKRLKRRNKSKEKVNSEAILLSGNKKFPKIPFLNLKRFSEDRSTNVDSLVSSANYFQPEKRKIVDDILKAIEDNR
ncbi:unnamed protein product [Blepharisma stoltei]|uniref:Uncharacterized protein n=1 Tax=Blepharisma stoltei TaxID=1481888 RepID=A0AAU9JVD3_9CILI|nr:unnamed protein product [Blepharisma stoltei]